MLIGTAFLLPDEKAYTLVELDQMSPDYKGKRRYQLTYVNRGDQIAEHRKDLGASRRFKAAQFRIPSLWEHTVGGYGTSLTSTDWATITQKNSRRRFRPTPRLSRIS